jgi:hypothetical protein
LVGNTQRSAGIPLKANRSPSGITQSGRRAGGLPFFPKSNDDG